MKPQNLAILLTDIAGFTAATAVQQVSAAINRYFDPASRRVQAAATLVQQVQAQIRTSEPPRVDETLAALATAAAGR